MAHLAILEGDALDRSAKTTGLPGNPGAYSMDYDADWPLAGYVGFHGETSFARKMLSGRFHGGQTVGKNLLRKVKNVAKKTVTAPGKIASKSLQYSLKPIIGKKASKAIGKAGNVVLNPFAQATLARKVTQKAIGKKAYSTASKAGTQFVKSNAGNIASIAMNTLVPGSGVAVKAGLMTANKVKSQLRAIKKTAPPALRSALAKKTIASVPEEIKKVVEDTLAPELEQAKAEQAQTAPTASTMPKWAIPAGLGVVALLFLKGRK